MFGEPKIPMFTNNGHVYNEIYPSDGLEDYVSLYFKAENLSDKPQPMTICPDGYFKLIIQLLEGKIVAYFLTGIWANEIDIVIPPKVVTYGIKFKVIAAELIFKREISAILNSVEQKETDYFGMDEVSFGAFEDVVKQLEGILLKKLPVREQIRANRIRLSQFLYNNFEDIQAREVAQQIHWSQREINRYLNKYIGISLKKYLNIQKCYRAYFKITEGEFFPEKGFFDQAHFIREVKKHTGQTPTALFKGQNDQFIQLRNIKKL